MIIIDNNVYTETFTSLRAQQSQIECAFIFLSLFFSALN